MKPQIEKHNIPVPNGAAESFEAVCQAGAKRHYGLWLRATQAAVSAMNGLGVSIQLPAMKLAISTTVLRVLDAANPSFRASHRHAEGGLYEVLGRVEVHTDKDKWQAGVRYRNEEGKEFVRTRDDFKKRMTTIIGE